MKNTNKMLRKTLKLTKMLSCLGFLVADSEKNE